MAEQNNNEVMIQLPWTVPQQFLVTTQIPVDPQTQKTPLDIQYSTDWIVAASILVSALISFIGFLATIYVVKKSTEVQLQSNKDVIESQNKMKFEELKILYKQHRAENLRILISEISLQGMNLLSLVKFRCVDNTVLESASTEIKIEDYHQFQNSITKIISYIRPGEKQDEKMREELFELLDLSRKMVINILENNSCSNFLQDFEYKLGYVQASLNFFLIEVLDEKAA